MVPTIESPRLGGGILHFSSQSRSPHHDAAASAIRSLRRSLSRSPSKAPTFRLVPSTTPSPSRQVVPVDAAPASPSSGSASSQPSSPLAISVPSGLRMNRASVRKPYPMRSASRARTSPGASTRRPLAQSKDHGNGASPSPASIRGRVGKRETRSASPAAMLKVRSASPEGETMQPVRDTPSASTLEVPRLEPDLPPPPAKGLSKTSSPLKRTESIIDLDRASFGSPVAKRRSLHGASFGADFNIFEQPSLQSRGELRDPPVAPAFGTAHHSPSPASPIFTAMPKRASSLRRSTLQQRHHERPTYAQSRPNPDLALEWANHGVSIVKPKPHRMSLDNFLAPAGRESPFTSAGAALPNASIHMLPGALGAGTGVPFAATRQAPAQPHPLSKAISQSSSASSVAEDSPSHAPVRPLHPDEPSRPKPDFAKSLPLGALRPVKPAFQGSGGQASSSTDASYATPPNYRLVKPLPAAFMSTGLISKRNRDPTRPLAGAGHTAMMPDTPCKRPTFSFQAAPLPTPNHRASVVKPAPHDIGSPASPFPVYRPRLRAGTGVGIFGTGGLSRSGSFLGSDNDDHPHSPSDSQPGDYDLPPTPTKPGLTPGKTPRSHGPTAAERSSLEPELPGRSSPHTPQESVLPCDPSRLSISGHEHGHASRIEDDPRSSSSSSSSNFFPATPTAMREAHSTPLERLPGFNSSGVFALNTLDASLKSRFDKIELIGTGEFSQVYRVTQVTTKPEEWSSQDSNSLFSFGSQKSAASVGDQVFAVKKSRRPYLGPRDRLSKLREVEILQALGQSDHVVHLVDSWEERDHLYIQTEFCEEGSLDMFLAQVGRKARLDDFRIWKIMLELCLGLKHVHDSGFIHLDLKPANVLITFEGVLKIGDFGMATRWPAEAGIEGEGDREYIGPEILMGQYDKPADIFALGLIMLEIAGNVELPENGPSWQKLRTGDMSDVPSLTWSSASNILRDSSGNPLSPRASSVGEDGKSLVTITNPTTTISSPSPTITTAASFSTDDSPRQPTNNHHHHHPGRSKPTPNRVAAPHQKQKQPQRRREGELREPPSFMLDPHHAEALDRLVRWMISPEPRHRPLIQQLLDTVGVKWAEARRRAGATVFEGNWGPADDVLLVPEPVNGHGPCGDAVMLDV